MLFARPPLRFCIISTWSQSPSPTSSPRSLRRARAAAIRIQCSRMRNSDPGRSRALLVVVHSLLSTASSLWVRGAMCRRRPMRSKSRTRHWLCFHFDGWPDCQSRMRTPVRTLLLRPAIMGAVWDSAYRSVAHRHAARRPNQCRPPPRGVKVHGPSGRARLVGAVRRVVTPPEAPSEDANCFAAVFRTLCQTSSGFRANDAL